MVRPFVVSDVAFKYDAFKYANSCGYNFVVYEDAHDLKYVINYDKDEDDVYFTLLTMTKPYLNLWKEVIN